MIIIDIIKKLGQIFILLCSVFSYIIHGQINANSLDDINWARIYLKKIEDRRGFNSGCVNLITVSQNFFDGTVIPGYLGSEKTLIDLFKEKVIESLSKDGFTVICSETDSLEKIDYNLELDLYRAWLTWKGSGKWDTEVKFGYLIFDAEKNSLVKEGYINYREILANNSKLKYYERTHDVLNRGMGSALKTFIEEIGGLKKGGK